MNYRTKILAIRSDYLHGKITLDEAKALVEPLLVKMNEKGQKISKEFNKKYKPLTFGYVFR